MKHLRIRAGRGAAGRFIPDPPLVTRLRTALRSLDVAPLALVAGVVILAAILASVWIALALSALVVVSVVGVAAAALGVRLWL